MIVGKVFREAVGLLVRGFKLKRWISHWPKKCEFWDIGRLSCKLKEEEY